MFRIVGTNSQLTLSLHFLFRMAHKYATREEDYSKWYNDLVNRADLAEHSDVRGCMVIKPYGYAIWEKMREILDGKFRFHKF